MMKLNKLSIFLLLLGVLLLSNLGNNIYENYSNSNSIDTTDGNYDSVRDEVDNSQQMNQVQQGLPEGIPASDIMPGKEDLYILKSEIVPPVCPKCPDATVCPRKEPCPPCPACERCPDPSYECKLVPNYEVGNFPKPVLNDFSTFGM